MRDQIVDNIDPDSFLVSKLDALIDDLEDPAEAELDFD